ncbi:hypothetical protein C4E44_33585 [Pseudomonas sp. MWU12-2312b]|nr:hypothetical protein C4E44_33585 [Pseudomonas sp. MWU12-2312b]
MVAAVLRLAEMANEMETELTDDLANRSGSRGKASLKPILGAGFGMRTKLRPITAHLHHRRRIKSPKLGSDPSQG